MSNRDSWTALELSFFARGEEVQPQPVETFADLDEGIEERVPLLKRLFTRKPRP
jgi:hypothetical protein